METADQRPARMIRASRTPITNSNIRAGNATSHRSAPKMRCGGRFYCSLRFCSGDGFWAVGGAFHFCSGDPSQGMVRTVREFGGAPGSAMVWGRDEEGTETGQNYADDRRRHRHRHRLDQREPTIGVAIVSPRRHRPGPPDRSHTPSTAASSPTLCALTSTAHLPI
ncbi:hypothetical protein AB0G04_36135 [Actinoplanes sp. NPDC023801]|uniref:hypothetical protein n=1 Tax=Actinoplanes sp. NPDC023801 TaxID=3154595 RepID=UPI0033C820BB